MQGTTVPVQPGVKMQLKFPQLAASLTSSQGAWQRVVLPMAPHWQPEAIVSKRHETESVAIEQTGSASAQVPAFEQPWAAAH